MLAKERAKEEWRGKGTWTSNPHPNPHNANAGHHNAGKGRGMAGRMDRDSDEDDHMYDRERGKRDFRSKEYGGKMDDGYRDHDDVDYEEGGYNYDRSRNRDVTSSSSHIGLGTGLGTGKGIGTFAMHPPRVARSPPGNPPPSYCNNIYPHNSPTIPL